MFLYIYSDYTTLSNIHIKDSTVISSNSDAASLVAFAGQLILNNCSSDAYVCGDAAVGGLIGYGELIEIIGCSFTGQVFGTGTEIVEDDDFNVGIGYGGLVGNTFIATIKNCYVDALIDGYSRVGGIIGASASDGGDDSIENCIVNATVRGREYVGIFCGGNVTAKFDNCAGYGQIFAKDTDDLVEICAFGGLGNYNFTNCFFIGNSNVDIDLRISNCTSCYISARNKKYYSSGTFADWGVVADMNNGLPLQKALFWAAEFGDDVSTSWFALNGFTAG